MKGSRFLSRKTRDIGSSKRQKVILRSGKVEELRKMKSAVPLVVRDEVKVHPVPSVT